MPETSNVSPDPEIQLRIDDEAGQSDPYPAPKPDTRPSHTAPEMIPARDLVHVARQGLLSLPSMTLP